MSRGPSGTCLYEGMVRHRRFGPRAHAFSYRLFWAFLDLDHMDEAFRGRTLWSDRRPAPARFSRKDHLGPPERPLSESVKDVVEQQAGFRPEGPVRLLTHLRYFGYVFNPVSFHFCYAADGSTLEAIVAEVTNTPWKEVHPYVLDARGRQRLRWSFPKAFHVSPFFGMEQSYDWSFSHPGDGLSVHMRNLEDGRAVFDATMTLRRREWNDANLRSSLLRFPLLTLRIIASIHWQALLLWLKRTPFHPHPSPKPV